MWQASVTIRVSMRMVNPMTPTRAEYLTMARVAAIASLIALILTLVFHR